MQQPIYLEPKMVPAQLRGSYSGNKFKVVITDSVTIPSHAGLWDGGSRDTYSAVHFETGHAVAVSDNMSAPWNSARQDQTIELKPGIAVIRSSMFCGKDMGLTFYIHADNAAKLLPAPSAELSEHEQIVLNATRSLKSSYNGRDRYQMAVIDHTPYGTLPKMTRAQWDDAKASLISQGLLNKAGAITVAGRNASKSI